MKTKMNITLTIVTIVIGGLFVSCQQGSNIENRVESEVSELRDNLNNIAEDDDNFITELQQELEDFEGSMNEIREDINEGGEEISMSARQAIDDLQGEARSLRMKLESHSAFTDTDRNITGTDRAITDDRTGTDRAITEDRTGTDNAMTEDRTGTDRAMTNDRDAVDGDRTAMMQRDTLGNDNSNLGDGMTGNDNDGPNVMQIDQELRAEFNNFRQNVNQWVDRLSVDTRDN